MAGPTSPRTTMTVDDVEVVDKTSPFEGYFRIDRYRLRHRLFEGGWGDEMSREIFERGHAVTVLLYDPDRERLVFIEQFRPGALAAMASPWYGDDFSPWLVESVAGIIGEGETPEQVAFREAVEEAGCEVLDLIEVCHYLVSPGGTSESIFVFCGRVDSSTSGGIHGLPEEHENTRVHVMAVDQALEWLEAGKFNNAMTLVAMQWFKINHRAVRERWSGT